MTGLSDLIGEFMDPVCAYHEIQETPSAIKQWFHVVAPGTTFEQATDSRYWRNVWQMLQNKQHSTIDLVADDGSWEAKVRVLYVADGIVKFRTIYHLDLASKATKALDVPPKYRIEHLAKSGWRAIDPAGTVVASNEPTKDDAIRAAAQHARKVAA
jgi:hypothetical protein